MFKLMDKKLFTILRSFFWLSGSMCLPCGDSIYKYTKIYDLDLLLKINELNFDIKALLLIAYILRVLYSDL